MTGTQWGALLEQWGAGAALIVTLSGVGLAWAQMTHNKRAGVSSDEHVARADEQVERRDTIADRDAMIDQLTEDCASWRTRALAAEARELEWIAVVSGHVPWDWSAAEIAHEAGRAADLGAAPPLRPPPPAPPS